tara:strand:- start:380 stop:592 length:213 start_codon:yes stop_codon:yes gene_type:complete
MTSKDIKLAVLNNDINPSDMVTILLLLANELQVYTISEMARKENKTPQGIRKSKKYTKFTIGSQLMTMKP